MDDWRHWEGCVEQLPSFFSSPPRCLTTCHFPVCACELQWISRQDNGDKLIMCERGDLVFVFNFHPTNSYTDYMVGAQNPGPYKVVLSSDEEVFGGFK